MFSMNGVRCLVGASNEFPSKEDVDQEVGGFKEPHWQVWLVGVMGTGCPLY
jgi:hypothetical protein